MKKLPLTRLDPADQLDFRRNRLRVGVLLDRPDLFTTLSPNIACPSAIMSTTHPETPLAPKSPQKEILPISLII